MTKSSFSFILTTAGAVNRYEIDIDTDPDSDLDVAASDPGWITDAVWMDNSKHMVYTSSLRLFFVILLFITSYATL